MSADPRLAQLRAKAEAVAARLSPGSPTTGRESEGDDLAALAAALDRISAVTGEQSTTLRAMLASMSEAVVVAERSGRVIYANKAAAELVDESLLFKAPASWSAAPGLYRADRTTPYPPEELPLARALRGEASDGVLMFVRTACLPEGRELSVTGQPLVDERGEHLGGLVVCRDVTQESRHRLQLQRLAAIVEASPDAIVSRGLDGRIETWNTGAERLYGYPASEMMGKPFDVLVPPELRDEQRRASARVLQGESVTLETERLRRDGTRVAVQMTLSPVFDGRGEVVAISGLARDITEQRRARELLAFQNALLEAQSEASLDGTAVVSPEGRILSFNRRFLELWGIPAEVGRGSSIDEALRVIGPQLARGVEALDGVRDLPRNGHDESRKEVLLRDGRVFDRFTAPLKGPGGTLYGRMWTFRDVTATRKAAQALADQERFLRHVIDAIPNLVFVKDRTGRFSLVNEAVASAYGSTVEDVTGRTDAEFARSTSELEAFRRQDQEVLDSGRQRFIPEEPLTDASGATRWLQTVKRPVLAEDGRATHVLGVSTDITERKAHEEALREARSAAEAANRAKSAFLAHMSHEIRTPLSAVLGFADLLLDERLPESERREFVMTIRRNGEHLLTLLDDILDLSKIEVGKMTVERVECSPGQLLHEVASLMQVRAAEKGLTFALRYERPIPATIRSDPTRLRQILLNLVGNAVKFTERGRVELVARCEAPEGPQPQLVVEVRDTGIGIAGEQAARLFQPFEQADPTMSRRYGGTGLGLAICGPLAAALGGRIGVASAPGRGSTFTLTLQLDGPLEVPLLATPTDVVPRSRRVAAGLERVEGRVLLAEDGLDNQVLFTTVLRRAGLEVEVVENGRRAVEEALAAVRAGRAFDLVLMDMQMPELDGYEATRKLRAEGYRGPVMALTAHAMPGERERCLAAGCDDYRTKAIDGPSLVSAIREVLGGPAAPEPPLHSTEAADPVMAELVAWFVSRLPTTATQMREALARDDRPALRRLAHQLKGAAGGYGFLPLTVAAAVVESAIIGGEDPAGPLEELLALCARVRPGPEGT